MLLLSVTLIICAGAVSAANIYVNGTSGKDTNSGNSWETAKQTISSATSKVNSGGTIYIAKGTYTGSKNTFITIKKNMTITGQSQSGTIIESQGNSAIFIINSGITVNLKKLTLEKGASLNGGAVINYGNLNVADTTFKKNTAGGDGGAIINYGRLTLTGTTFAGNKAGGGGAIFNYGTLNANNSTFTGNSVNEDEYSSGYGGAISSTGTTSITNCTFKNNTAPFNGGAIYNTGSLKVTGSNFTGNQANDDGIGGAIYNLGTASLTNSNITSSMSASGAISNDNIFTVDNCVFKDNKGLTAAAIINGGSGTFTLKNSAFTGNAIDNDGGAIFNYGNFIILGSTFTGNNATNSVFVGKGGAIVNMGTMSITGSIFNKNAAVTAGAILNGANLSITGSSFKNNHVTYQGGAIINTGSLKVVSSTFTGNTVSFSNGGGGAILNKGTLKVTSSTFTSNKAGGGGAISNQGKCTVNFSMIVGNKAVWDGSAIFHTGTSMDANNNWWGTNKPSFKSLIWGGYVNHSTWIMLRISASPVTAAYQGNTKVTVDLTWNTKDGFTPYKQLSGGYIHDKTPVTFGIQSGKGTISPKTSLTAQGKSYTTYTSSYKETAKIYAKLDNQTKTTSFSVPATVSISQLISASATIQKYYTTHNNKLPSSLKVAGQTLTMPQLLKLFTTASINIYRKNLKPISVTAVKNPTSPGGIYVAGKLYNYLTIAKNIDKFINSNRRAPNNAQTTLGKIPFSKLVYTYAKVVNFYGQNKRLPNYVTI